MQVNYCLYSIICILIILALVPIIRLIVIFVRIKISRSKKCRYGGQRLVLRYVDITNNKETVDFLLSSPETAFEKSNNIFDKLLVSVQWKQ